MLMKKKNMEKTIKNGKVGVIISKGWGSGFYTLGAPLEAVFNPQLIELIEKEDFDEATEFIKKTYQDVYSKQSFLSNTSDLVVEWVEEGREFYVTEYDGMESIVFKDEIKWIKA